MWILTVYALVVVVMELIVVVVGLALDRIYPSISLTISLSLFFLVPRLSQDDIRIPTATSLKASRPTVRT